MPRDIETSAAVIPPPLATPKHIAVANHSTIAKNDDLVFHVEAARLQILHDVAPAWGFAPPGVAFYGSLDKLPAHQAAIVGIADSDGNADSAGYHAEIAGLIYAIVDVKQSAILSRTFTHEVQEMTINPRLDRKVLGPKDRFYYVESTDPVQDRHYEMTAEIFGEKRKVIVADFVLPAWFGLPNQPGFNPRQTTFLAHRMGLEDDLEPFETTPGGYQIVEERDGEVLFLSAGAFRMNRSSHGRTRRILNRKFAVA